MPILYIANRNYSSWSLRPWVLMRERRIAFEEVLVPFGGNAEFRDFRAFSPSGKVPCLVDDDGTVVWDSLAIVEYLAEASPGIWPAGRAPRAWARSAAAEMHAGFALRATCTMNCGLRVRLHEVSAPLQADVERIDRV